MVPTRAEVSEVNQKIFDQLQKKVGFVPNLYAYMGKNDTALSDYLTLQNRKSTLRPKEKEAVNLVTSQINQCAYCLSAHTTIAKNLGFTDEEIMELRMGGASFNNNLDALVKLTASVVKNHGEASQEAIDNFFRLDYTETNLIDVVIAIADKIITNYIHQLTHVEIDWPLADDVHFN